VVPDVDAFPGHIACSSSARSEIVVPIHNASGEVVAVLDVDSSSLDQFDAIDASYLEQICSACAPVLSMHPAEKTDAIASVFSCSLNSAAAATAD
jgi:GAF domain-containing protein